MNWRGRNLRDIATIISLIAATSTESGPKVHCSLDKTFCPEGIRVADVRVEAFDIRRDDFRGKWNYALLARPEDNDDEVIC